MKKNKILEKEQAIHFVKTHFSDQLSKALHLYPISSPMIVEDGKGINDDLNGTERPVSFPVKFLNDNRAVVVHSLAKWKRIRLQELGLEPYEGILTDMKALRPDEDSSPIHSIYVDQWDWELRIQDQDRKLSFLKKTVLEIYKALLATEEVVAKEYLIPAILPKKLHFIHAQELLDLFPNLDAKGREYQITKRFGAVFIIGIGGRLSDGKPHDNRAADYDDWSTLSEYGLAGLNGDLLVWNPVLNAPLELTSMGIRVDKAALIQQLKTSNASEKSNLHYHQLVLNQHVPTCIGGGLGQSRICMFLLRKQHIGEVQASIWPQEIRSEMLTKGIELL